MDKKIIARNFSRYADLYDRYCQVQNLAALELLARVKNKRFKNILELGCGTGNFTNFLAKKFPKANIKAVDISREMLKVAGRKIKYKNVEFMLADAEKIILKDKFDLITSNASAQWFDDLGVALVKYSKMMAKKGTILFSIFGPKTYKELDFVLRLLVNNKNISAGNFLNHEEIMRIFRNSFKTCIHDEKVYQDEFLSLAGLLKSIKYTGVRGEGLQVKGCLTANMLKKLEKTYIKKYAKIRASYQVFFCEARL